MIEGHNGAGRITASPSEAGSDGNVFGEPYGYGRINAGAIEKIYGCTEDQIFLVFGQRSPVADKFDSRLPGLLQVQAVEKVHRNHD